MYLEKKPWRQALHLFLDACGQYLALGDESVPAEESLGRVTSREVVARIPSPGYDSAAMDGIAARAESTVGATLSSPKRLVIGKDAEPVETGDPVGDPFDSVIMVEEINRLKEDVVEIYSPVPPYRNVRRRGEDFNAGASIVPKSHIVRPVDLAGILAGGVTQVLVKRRPTVAIIPTGSELVEPGRLPEPGQIIESNSRMISGMVAAWGGEPRRVNTVENRLESIRNALAAAARVNDVVVTIAGSSAGTRDLVPQAVEELGEVLVHGVDLMPGKPAVLGLIERKPLAGLPGYPVSAWVAADTFLKPLVFHMLGLDPPSRARLRGVLSQDLVSRLGMEELVRVHLSQHESGWTVTPLPRGAGLITSLIRADGILRIPPDLEGLNEGAEVEVELMDG